MSSRISTKSATYFVSNHHPNIFRIQIKVKILGDFLFHFNIVERDSGEDRFNLNFKSKNRKKKKKMLYHTNARYTTAKSVSDLGLRGLKIQTYYW